MQAYGLQHIPQEQPEARNETHPQHRGIARQCAAQDEQDGENHEHTEQKSQEQKRERCNLFEGGLGGRKCCAPHKGCEEKRKLRHGQAIGRVEQ